MAMKTKGTELFVLDPRDSIITKIDCPKGVTGLGGSKPKIDETCLDSDGEESGPGMYSAAEVSVPLDYDVAKASHMLLEDLDENDVIAKWVIGLGDGTAVPTADSSGDFNLPTTRTWIPFTGYIANIPLDFAVNANVASTFTIQPSGRRKVIAKVLI